MFQCATVEDCNTCRRRERIKLAEKNIHLTHFGAINTFFPGNFEGYNVQLEQEERVFLMRKKDKVN